MTTARFKESLPPVGIDVVDQMTREHDAIEPPAQIQLLDSPEDALGVLHVGQHLRRLIHRRHAVTQLDQSVSYSACSGTQLQDVAAVGDCPVDDTGFIARGEPQIDLDGASIGSDSVQFVTGLGSGSPAVAAKPP